MNKDIIMSGLLTIIVEDVENDNRMYFLTSENEEQTIEQNWYESDEVLDNLKALSTFSNVTCWNDLSIEQWKILIAINVLKVRELSMEEQMDSENPHIQSISFFFLGFATKLGELTHSYVDLLKVRIISEEFVDFDYDLSPLPIPMSYTDEDEEGKKIENNQNSGPQLSIVVDNENGSDNEEE